jgi:poly(A) polymerase Pap1
MATQPPAHLGVTPPLAVVAPTEKEIAANDELIEELKRQKNFESAEATEKRCLSRLSHAYKSLTLLQESSPQIYSKDY